MRATSASTASRATRRRSPRGSASPRHSRGRRGRHGSQVMQRELIDYERRETLALLTLNRPDKLNAINAAMIDGLGRALDAAEADDDVRVIVLAGAGRAFSSGFDL